MDALRRFDVVLGAGRFQLARKVTDEGCKVGAARERLHGSNARVVHDDGAPVGIGGGAISRQEWCPTP